MLRPNLANKLVTAKNAAERKRLLQGNPKLADEKLALKIKDICYAAWTSEPTIAQKAEVALISLFKFNPLDEIEAILLWVTGISCITAGNLEAAVAQLDRSATVFITLGRDHEAAQTQVAKLIALALLGRYDEAVATGNRALTTFDKYGDDVAAGKVEKNLGNIVSRQDRHLEAERYYLSARARFIKTGETAELIMAETGLAITCTHLHDFKKAEKVFTVALENARMGKMLPFEAGIEASIGNLALFRGRYDEALRFLELSRRKYQDLNMPHQTAVAGLEIADIYSELNLLPEAIEIYSDVSGTLSKLKLQGDEARARANYGRASAAAGDAGGARRELKRSAKLYEREGNKTGAAAVKLTEAKLELDQDRPAIAIKLLMESEKLLSESDSLRHKLTVKLLKAEALAQTGSTSEAEELLSDVLAGARKQEQPTIALAALHRLGNMALTRDDNHSAKKHFKNAVGIIETMRAPLPGEEFRMAFLANKLEPFEKLAGIFLAENKLEDAFSFFERAKSRALAEILEDGPGFQSAGLADELTVKIDEVRDELNWYYTRLNRANEEEIGSLQTAVKKREKQLAAVMRQAESTAEHRAGGISLDLKRLRDQLGPRTALVEYVNVDGVFSAFVVDDKGIRFTPNVASSGEILSLLEGLQFQFGALRYGANIPEKFAAQLKIKADVYLEKLYEKLIRPIEKNVSDRDLVIIPSGALNYVPFPALRKGERYLIESREILCSPSAAVWLALREKLRGDMKNSLLIGYADETIPLVDSEIDMVAQLLPNAKTFKGKRASFAAYTENASQFDLLHLACHGQFRPDNPMFSSLHLADGWITVRDICRQTIHASLVTLSACETGLSRVFAGDEIIGLARGFLSAGATSLVLSLWTVNDASAAQLMHIFYESLQRGNPIAASLRIAQCEFIKRGTHPYFWSPFVLIGK